MATQFRAYFVEENPDGVFRRSLVTRSTDDLPAGDLLIRVQYSSLNYKDALSATGNKGVTRKYPHTPGVDAVGIVEASAAPEFAPGDAVIVIGYDLGMNTPGGFGGYIRVPSGWAVKLPAGLTMVESMLLGTAGFTAAQCVEALREHGLTPDDGEVLVTGATGGVGSVAVGILGLLGHPVVAATGKPDEAPYLRALGASRIVHRDEIIDTAGKALLREQWAGVVDTVGGTLLASAVKATRYGGSVAACGNAASPLLELTVYPFILRAVKLLGIDSVNCSIECRRRLWNRLADDWRLPMLEDLGREVTLEGLDREIDVILQGKQRGRVVLAHRQETV